MADTDCIFCRIISGATPTTKVFEDDLACAFEDNNPQAPTHVLVVPREHLDSLNDAAAGDEPLLGHLLRIASKVANQLSIAESGPIDARCDPARAADGRFWRAGRDRLCHRG